MIELEARNALSGRCDGRLRELSQLTAINEGFQNVLLDVEVVIVDIRQRFLESRQIFDGFVDAVIVDVVARGLGPQDDVITNVLLDEAVAIGCEPPDLEGSCLRSRFAACPDIAW